MDNVNLNKDIDYFLNLDYDDDVFEQAEIQKIKK